MKKKILLISILAVLAAVFLIARAANNRKETRSIIVKKKQKEIDGRTFIIQGEEYEKERRYLEARDSYWKAIEKSFDNEIIKEAEKRIYRLNMKILFSPIITKDSQKYVVVKGDTLSKIAKKFGTTVELLMKSNQLRSDLIKPGMEFKISTAKYSIVVDRSQNILILKSDEAILKIYSVSTGLNNVTPLGNFKIVIKEKNPTWYATGAVIPPESPENILGSRWMGISKSGYGIHGTTQPETIGKHITAGCIRMVNRDVEELYGIIPVGTEVTIAN